MPHFFINSSDGQRRKSNPRQRTSTRSKPANVEKTLPTSLEKTYLGDKHIHLYNIFRFRVWPILAVIVCPFFVMFLIAQGTTIASIQWGWFLGNAFSWKVVLISLIWSWLWCSHYLVTKTCRVPGEEKLSNSPLYSDNGVIYYITSICMFIGLHYFYRGFSVDIYLNMPYILGSLNITAIILCIYLLLVDSKKGKQLEERKKMPYMYQFYAGKETHPDFLNANVKQWTNCRFGMMAWQILIFAFLNTSIEQNGVLNPGLVASVTLQTVYIAKFFIWEKGYFHTLDMTLDRAGFYICWGCLVWVPALYTFSTFYLVAHPSPMNEPVSVIVIVAGIISIVMNYLVDYEKQCFRSKNFPMHGSSKITFIEARDEKGNIHKLLTCGYWGRARHLNYTFELLAASAWCSPSWIDLAVSPFAYTVFLTALLLQRTLRDEDKCSRKYGVYWNMYCQKVPYRFIPGLI